MRLRKLFGRKDDKKHRKTQQEAYDRVYQLHEKASFLYYINDAYEETWQGQTSIKLEGLVAKGKGYVTDRYQLYSCSGKWKAEITMEELYVGNDRVDCLEGGDKRVACYPVEQQVPYKAGDILCKLKEETDATDNE